MTPEEIERYIAAAAVVQGLQLDPDQKRRVAAVFARNAGVARLVDEFDLPDGIEPAPVFHP